MPRMHTTVTDSICFIELTLSSLELHFFFFTVIILLNNISFISQDLECMAGMKKLGDGQKYSQVCQVVCRYFKIFCLGRDSMYQFGH